MSKYNNYSNGSNVNDGRNGGGFSGRGRGNGSNTYRNQNSNAVTGRSSPEGGGGNISNSSGHRNNNIVIDGYRDQPVREGSREQALLMPRVDMSG